MVLCCLFWCQSFGDLSPYLVLFIILLRRFWLLSSHLLGNSCALGWPFVLIVFCLFVFYLFPILVLRASAITMPELVEINLVSDDDNSLSDRKGHLS